MSRSNLRFMIQSGLVIAALALVAIPLANLLVADAGPAVSTLNQAETADAVEATAELEIADGSSAVSTLVAGNAVGGGRRGFRFGLRRPASAYVP